MFVSKSLFTVCIFNSILHHGMGMKCAEDPINRVRQSIRLCICHYRMTVGMEEGGPLCRLQ